MLLSGLSLSFILPRAVFAAPPQFTDLGGILDTVLSYIFPIGAILAVIMIVYGGYMWMMSAGDPGKIKSAQGTLTWAIIGLVFLGIFGLIVDEIIKFIS